MMSADERNATLAVVEQLLQAMNQVSASGVPLTMEDVQRLFTPDCAMTVNGEPICQGHEGLLAHAHDIGAKLASWRFNLPFERTAVDGGEAVTYYTCDTVAHDGTRGRAYDMAIYSVQDGRISGVCEVVHFAGHEVRLEQF